MRTKKLGYVHAYSIYYVSRLGNYTKDFVSLNGLLPQFLLHFSFFRWMVDRKECHSLRGL